MDDEDCYFCSRALDSGSVRWSHWSLFIVCGLSVVPNWLNITSSKGWRQCGSILPTNSRASQWLLHRLLFLLQRRIFVSEILEIEGHHWSNVKSSLMSNPILEVQPLELVKKLTPNQKLTSEDSQWLVMIGRTPFHRTLNELEHHFLKMERTGMC